MLWQLSSRKQRAHQTPTVQLGFGSLHRQEIEAVTVPQLGSNSKRPQCASTQEGYIMLLAID